MDFKDCIDFKCNKVVIHIDIFFILLFFLILYNTYTYRNLVNIYHTIGNKLDKDQSYDNLL